MNSSGHSFKGMTPHEAKESTILPFTLGKDFSDCLHLKQSGSSFSVWAAVNIRQTIYAPLSFLEPQSKHQPGVQVQVRQTAMAAVLTLATLITTKVTMCVFETRARKTE